MPDLTEKNFETIIEASLLTGGPDDTGLDVLGETRTAYGEFVPGGFHRRTSADYDVERCLIPDDLFAFLYATQPQAWQALVKLHGSPDEAKRRLLSRLVRAVERSNTLSVLRKELRCDGQRFRLYYPRPASGLNPDLQTQYEGNLFSAVRQLHFSPKDQGRERRKSVDLALFLNGLPLFTVELKNQLTNQRMVDAQKQYRRRDAREPLFAYGRCLAHFAVDPEAASMTTHLEGEHTRFLPFNLGYNHGAGNPPPSMGDTFATAYLWEQVWSKDSILDLLQHFIHEVEELDDDGEKTGKKSIVFPRYHQLDAVRRLVRDARSQGPGQRYLVQHSAGSGKSYTIGWLAHQLASLHDAQDEAVFDSVVIITDRRVLDRQLQQTVRQLEQVEGVVENIDRHSSQLKDALAQGKKIIVTTLQKFPVIAGEMEELGGHRFAVVIDEAHSSQSGESSKSLKQVLSTNSLDEAEAEDLETGDDLEDRIVAEVRTRGPLSHISYFAFTATPKDKTLELFGTHQPDGSYQPFSLYSMRQAIEEGFIMDVLAHYTTHSTYWRLLKTIEEDPSYERGKASALLRSFVDLSDHAIDRKVQIIVEHFVGQVMNQIRGRAKAMVVTRSRLHAVRFKRAMDRYLQEQGYPIQTLVAFSGTVVDGGIDYTESNMNGGIPESRTADVFDQNAYRIMIVANKFQTGFDQPLLHTMYVDKKLSGVHAVQTLSRLNRIHPDKQTTGVLDFVNGAEEIQESFSRYYDRTILSEGTDPNLLHDLEERLEEFYLFSRDDVDSFAQVYFSDLASEQAHPQLMNLLRPTVERYERADQEAQSEFRRTLGEYVRLYAFLSQILPFADPELEKLYVFSRYLLRRLPINRQELPLEVQQQIDVEAYRIRETFAGRIEMERGKGVINPRAEKSGMQGVEDEKEPLSAIIQELNQVFGIGISPEDGRHFTQHFESKLDEDPALAASARVNSQENARLTFDHVAKDKLQEMMNFNWKLYKLLNDDEAVSGRFFDFMFDRYWRRSKAG